jgi:ppGpp synthetase/RelA/SpoT-type nucleotidyltranferase
METSFPGGSKGRVNKAGENVRKGIATIDDENVIDTWRAAHRAVLNTFQAILRTRTKNTNIVVAQRHKRKRTIYDKLERYEKMLLSRMDDVAGCRLIFEDIEQLYAFRNKILKSRFRHRRKNEIDKYDYIKKPKSTGYRGIHDVYSYDVNSEHGKEFEGLLIELQYRTLIQHAWATAVEIVGLITENQPKFNRGDGRYRLALAYASEILSRAHESKRGPFPEYDHKLLVKEFLKLDEEIHLLRLLKGLNATNTKLSQNKNTILVFNREGVLEVRTFKDATEALKELFILEKSVPHEDIVLVKADTSEDIRLAFRNYFSDASEFIRLVEEGCEKLSGFSIK